MIIPVYSLRRPQTHMGTQPLPQSLTESKLEELTETLETLLTCSSAKPNTCDSLGSPAGILAQTLLSDVPVLDLAHHLLPDT